jgi:RNA polymerase sigma factor (sigma-70 family)
MQSRLSEDQLILAISNRSRIGAEALYDMYSASLFKVIYNIVKQQEHAEDVLQQTFIKIWQSIGGYQTQKGRLYTWMITIARNLSKDSLRTKAYHNQQKNSDIETAGYDIDKQHNTSININTFGVKDFLNKLKKEHKEILNLIYFQGYTHVEVADELGIPVGTVKTRWKAGIKTLRAKMA